MEWGPVLWLLDALRGRQQSRRRLRVGVHRAFFQGGSVPLFFIKVTNLSPSRDVEVTHVWFQGSPAVQVMLKERPLPTRLRSDETWEGWWPIADVQHIANPERAVRVRLSNGKVVKSREDKASHPQEASEAQVRTDFWF